MKSDDLKKEYEKQRHKELVEADIAEYFKIKDEISEIEGLSKKEIIDLSLRYWRSHCL